jgi:AraC-like DNA-binding protein
MPGMPNRNALHPEGSGGRVSRGELVAEDRMTLGFRHLDVMLAIGKGTGPGGLAAGPAILDIKRMCAAFGQPKDVARFLQATDKAICAEDALHAPAIESSGGPIVEQLSSALAAAKCVDGRHTEIYADAVRLAIVARLLCLQSEAQRSTRCTSGVSNSPAGRQMRPLQKWRLKRVMEYVDKHLADKITLSDLAAVAGLSPMHFASQFRAATNLRPHDYLLLRRIRRAEILLRRSTMTLVEISLTVGFQTQAHFTTVFKRFVGDTPYRWRRSGGRISPLVTAAERTAMAMEDSDAQSIPLAANIA